MDLLSFAQSRLILLSQAWNVHANRYEGLQLRCARFCLQPEGQVHAQNLRNSLFALDSIQDTSKLAARSPKCPANVRKQVLGCPAHSHLTFGPNGHSSKQSYSPTCSQDLHGFSDAPDAHVGKAELLQCQSRLQACRKQLSALRRHPCLPEPGLEGIAGHQNHACCMGISRSSAVKLRLQSVYADLNFCNLGPQESLGNRHACVQQHPAQQVRGRNLRAYSAPVPNKLPRLKQPQD